jgi:hypothetical protein
LYDFKIHTVFYDAGVDLLPSGGHVTANGLHMPRGVRLITVMAAAQKNIVERTVSKPTQDRLTECGFA